MLYQTKTKKNQKQKQNKTNQKQKQNKTKNSITAQEPWASKKTKIKGKQVQFPRKVIQNSRDKEKIQNM